MIIKNIYVCNNHNGKMQGVSSLSTSPSCNKYCLARCKNKNNTCYKCYSMRELKRYKSLANLLEKNTLILTSKILNKSELPLLNDLIIRFESFADINNDIQVINYFNICKANKYTTFTLFTKNLFIIDEVLKAGYKKPKNLLIVASSIQLNKINEYEKYKYFIDKIFTVYTPDYIKNNNIIINCSKKCIDCKLCYTKNNVKYISEKLK